MAVKDVFDIAGHRTTRFDSRPIRRLLAPPRRLIVCSPQAPVWSGRPIAMRWPTALDGENVHYGTPINPKAPDRIPGGIRTIDLKEVASAKLAREHLVRHIDELLRDDALLALPTPDGIASRLAGGFGFVKVIAPRYMHGGRSGSISDCLTAANQWRTAPYTGNAPRAGRQGRTH